VFAEAPKGFGLGVVRLISVMGTALGARAYATLNGIPFPVCLVDLLRTSESIPATMEERVALNVPALWVRAEIAYALVGGRTHDDTLFTGLDHGRWKDDVVRNT
jgi:uncharacterized protein